MSEIKSLYRDENDLHHTVINRISEEWDGALEQWHLKKIEFIFLDLNLPVRSENRTLGHLWNIVTVG